MRHVTYKVAAIASPKAHAGIFAARPFGFALHSFSQSAQAVASKSASTKSITGIL